MRTNIDKSFNNWNDITLNSNRPVFKIMASKSAYTTDHAESVLSTHRWRTLSNSAQFILPHLKPGMKVLDVGCGPGSLTVDIAKHIQPGGHVTGIENVPDPLQEARKLAEQEGVDVTFEVADAMHMPYADDQFDLVFAHQVLQHVAQPVKMLKEMRRVARAGSGIVACRESTVPVCVILVLHHNTFERAW
jgi:ubiquinone/menaquinone biosynthesis C-methylase UbiE